MADKKKPTQTLRMRTPGDAVREEHLNVGGVPVRRFSYTGPPLTDEELLRMEMEEFMRRMRYRNEMHRAIMKASKMWTDPISVKRVVQGSRPSDMDLAVFMSLIGK